MHRIVFASGRQVVDEAGPAGRLETAGQRRPHLPENRFPNAGRVDRSRPRGSLRSRRVATVLIPRDFLTPKHAPYLDRLASTRCPQKQSSLYIRKVQYTALSIA